MPRGVNRRYSLQLTQRCHTGHAKNPTDYVPCKGVSNNEGDKETTGRKNTTARPRPDAGRGRAVVFFILDVAAESTRRAFKLHVNSRPAPPSQSATRRGVKSDKGNGHFVKSHDARGDGRGRGVSTGGLRLPAAPAPPAPLRRAEGVARGRLYEPLIRLER